jgi:hypothetical protein
MVDFKTQDGITLYPSAAEQVMERLMRLDRRACVRMRDTFPPGPSRWYVWSGHIQVTGATGGGYAPGESGDSPESAIIRTWGQIMAITDDPGTFFLRFNCQDNVPIPGDDPQVWVRWDEETDDWVDVKPTAEMLAAHCVPADRVRSYAEQRYLDRQ